MKDIAQGKYRKQFERNVFLLLDARHAKFLAIWYVVFSAKSDLNLIGRFYNSMEQD